MASRHPIPEGQGFYASPKPVPTLFALEQEVLDTPVLDWVRKAEEAEEERWAKVHGPDHAPPRPPWPSYWCADCDGWMPTNAIHGHGPVDLTWDRRHTPIRTFPSDPDRTPR